jgi:hypothetical protein
MTIVIPVVELSVQHSPHRVLFTHNGVRYCWPIDHPSVHRASLLRVDCRVPNGVQTPDFKTGDEVRLQQIHLMPIENSAWQ